MPSDQFKTTFWIREFPPAQLGNLFYLWLFWCGSLFNYYNYKFKINGRGLHFINNMSLQRWEYLYSMIIDTTQNSLPNPDQHSLSVIKCSDAQLYAAFLLVFIKSGVDLFSSTGIRWIWTTQERRPKPSACLTTWWLSCRGKLNFREERMVFCSRSS